MALASNSQTKAIACSASSGSIVMPEERAKLPENVACRLGIQEKLDCLASQSTTDLPLLENCNWSSSESSGDSDASETSSVPSPRQHATSDAVSDREYLGGSADRLECGQSREALRCNSPTIPHDPCAGIARTAAPSWTTALLNAFASSAQPHLAGTNWHELEEQPKHGQVHGAVRADSSTARHDQGASSAGSATPSWTTSLLDAFAASAQPHLAGTGW